mmetsp:Transcript_48750/g.56234  ORF Transcript_48750/g.56234 Transcript_48750/m.56234 type:complete len:536 (+) Transcript_48750:58-1665(+)
MSMTKRGRKRKIKRRLYMLVLSSSVRIGSDAFLVGTLKRSGFDTTTSTHRRLLFHSLNAIPNLILPSHPDFPITSVMAPMVAASDYPFRLFLREYCDVDLTYTQMLLSKRFVVDSTFRKAHLDLYETQATIPSKLLPSQIECLGDDIHHYEKQHQHQHQRQFKREKSAPLMVQLAGDDVKTVVQSALMIYEHTDGKLTGIDLNCGCPQKIASKGNYGAFLMERDPELVNEILSALRKNLPPTVAVSAKIRLPVNDDTLIERIPRLLDTGINFLTVHGRTLDENKSKAGACNIDRIRLAVQTAHKHNPNFPVIANGGMENYNDICSILQSTGASAAMSSEALLETPNLFLRESMDIKTPAEQFHRQLSFANDYLNICSTVGPPLPGVLGFNKGGTFSVVRGHLFKFLHRYINTDHQDLRSQLAANGVTTMRTLQEARNLVDELESRYVNFTEDQWKELSSSSPLSSWYRRHRKPNRRVHERYTSTATNSRYNSNSVDDRKREIKGRIARLKAQKLNRQEKRLKGNVQRKRVNSSTV